MGAHEFARRLQRSVADIGLRKTAEANTSQKGWVESIESQLKLVSHEYPKYADTVLDYCGQQRAEQLNRLTLLVDAVAVNTPGYDDLDPAGKKALIERMVDDAVAGTDMPAKDIEDLKKQAVAFNQFAPGADASEADKRRAAVRKAYREAAKSNVTADGSGVVTDASRAIAQLNEQVKTAAVSLKSLDAHTTEVADYQQQLEAAAEAISDGSTTPEEVSRLCNGAISYMLSAQPPEVSAPGLLTRPDSVPVPTADEEAKDDFDYAAYVDSHADEFNADEAAGYARQQLRAHQQQADHILQPPHGVVATNEYGQLTVQAVVTGEAGSSRFHAHPETDNDDIAEHCSDAEKKLLADFDKVNKNLHLAQEKLRLAIEKNRAELEVGGALTGVDAHKRLREVAEARKAYDEAKQYHKSVCQAVYQKLQLGSDSTRALTQTFRKSTDNMQALFNGLASLQTANLCQAHKIQQTQNKHPIFQATLIGKKDGMLGYEFARMRQESPILALIVMYICERESIKRGEPWGVFKCKDDFRSTYDQRLDAFNEFLASDKKEARHLRGIPGLGVDFSASGKCIVLDSTAEALIQQQHNQWQRDFTEWKDSPEGQLQIARGANTNELKAAFTASADGYAEPMTVDTARHYVKEAQKSFADFERNHHESRAKSADDSHGLDASRTAGHDSGTAGQDGHIRTRHTGGGGLTP